MAKVTFAGAIPFGEYIQRIQAMFADGKTATREELQGVLGDLCTDVAEGVMETVAKVFGTQLERRDCSCDSCTKHRRQERPS